MEFQANATSRPNDSDTSAKDIAPVVKLFMGSLVVGDLRPELGGGYSPRGRSVRLFRQSPLKPKPGAAFGSLSQKRVNDATLGAQNQCASPFSSIAHQRAVRGACFQSISTIDKYQRNNTAMSTPRIELGRG